jgi:hypothetical protein
MPAYFGSSLVLTWNSSAGSVNPNTDYLTFSYNPSIDFAEQTAGADTTRTYLAGLKDGAASLTMIDQDGTAGTAMTAVFQEGQVGTLIWYPLGSAAGKPKFTAPFFSLGAVPSYTFNGRTEIAISLKQNGARTEGTAP